MGEYLQNDTEPVKNFKFPKRLISSLFCDGLNILAFKLGLSLELCSIRSDIDVSHIVDFGLEYFGEISDLCGFELLIDKYAIDMI